MKRLLTIALFALAATSCCKPKPNPNPNPDPQLDSYYTYHGITTQLSWAGRIDYDQYWMQPGGLGFYISPKAPRVDSLVNASALEELIYVNIKPEMVGETINLAERGEWILNVRNTARGFNYECNGYEDEDDDDTGGTATNPGGSDTPPHNSLISQGEMSIRIEGDSLFVSINLTFADGEKLDMRYKDKFVNLLVNIGDGSITDNNGDKFDIIDASCAYYGYEDSYNIVMQAGKDENAACNLTLIIPGELVGQSIHLTERGSPTGRVPWSYVYRNTELGIMFSGSENSPYGIDDTEDGYLIMNIDTHLHMFHIEASITLSNGRGQLSYNYTGILVN